MLNEIPGVSCVKPDGAMYRFLNLTQKFIQLKMTKKFMLDLLKAEKFFTGSGYGL